MDDDFGFTVTNWSRPPPRRGVLDRIRALARRIGTKWRNRTTSSAIEWGVDFDSPKPAVLTMPFPPWEAKAVKKGRCMRCWGRLVGRMDHTTYEFTGIRCVVCGTSVEGEQAQSEYERMQSESTRNAVRRATGSSLLYEQDPPFVMALFPQVERETEEQLRVRVAAGANTAKERWLTRRDFPVGSPGYFFLQAKLLMSSVEKLPRVLSASSFANLDVDEHGTATFGLPIEGARNDLQFFSYDMSQRLGCTMTAALMSAFACELAMKAIRLTLLDEARKDHDLLTLFDDLPVASQSRIETAWPGIRPVLEKARHAFGKWRYFETAVGERGIGAMSDTEQALALGKAARVILDEAEFVGLSYKVELSGKQDVTLSAGAKKYAYTHHFRIVGGETGRPIGAGVDHPASPGRPAQRTSTGKGTGCRVPPHDR